MSCTTPEQMSKCDTAVVTALGTSAFDTAAAVDTGPRLKQTKAGMTKQQHACAGEHSETEARRSLCMTQNKTKGKCSAFDTTTAFDSGPHIKQTKAGMMKRAVRVGTSAARWSACRRALTSPRPRAVVPGLEVQQGTVRDPWRSGNPVRGAGTLQAMCRTAQPRRAPRSATPIQSPRA
jgi:hypothetical protein